MNHGIHAFESGPYEGGVADVSAHILQAEVAGPAGSSRQIEQADARPSRGEPRANRSRQKRTNPTRASHAATWA